MLVAATRKTGSSGRGLYTTLLTIGNLNSYLANIDQQAEEMFSRLVKELATREDITEKLRLENQMKWVQRINNIQNRIMEIINNDLILA